MSDRTPRRRVKVVVHDRPRAQPRQRRGPVLYARSLAVEEYKRTIAFAYRLAARGVRFDDGPVHVTVIAVFPRPKTRQAVDWPGADGDRPHTAKPDADNLAKAVLDALNGTAWRDDAQVSRLHVVKRVAHPDRGDDFCGEVTVLVEDDGYEADE